MKVENEKNILDNFLSIEQIKADISEISLPQYLKTKVDLTKNVIEPVPVIQQGDSVIFSRGNISTIGGKAKSRKTFLIVLMANDFLSNSPAGKLLIVDTEMATPHVYKTARRIHRMLGWDTRQNNDRLTVLSLREYTPIERVFMFSEAIAHYQPELCFLDGVRDLLNDFNNIDDSNMVVQLLMKLSTQYDCHICSVLHENKGNSHLRGHLGTELINKSETVMEVAANDETSTVKPAQTRNLPFEEFSFRINDSGLPEYCDEAAKPPKVDNLLHLFQKIFSDGGELPWSHLHKMVMSEARVKDTAARNRINEAKRRSIILERSNVYYLNPVPLDILPF